jgi:hypothetical protein
MGRGTVVSAVKGHAKVLHLSVRLSKGTCHCIAILGKLDQGWGTMSVRL